MSQKKGKTQKRKALGRGLASLLPQSSSVQTQEISEPKAPQIPDENKLNGVPEKEDRLAEVNINSVHPSEYQPRSFIDENKLEELTESIREKGVLSPVIVRSDPDGGYIIIAGERRWRAARLAGITKLPVIIKETDELESFELALVENIQRENLTPLEEAESYRYLITSRGYQHDEVAQKVGKKRSTVTNILRLLRLPDQIKEYLKNGLISQGHAQALLALPNEQIMLEYAKEVINKKLSVRELEKLVQKGKKNKNRSKPPLDPAIKTFEDELRQSLGTKVKIKPKKNGKGTITIEYHSMEQLDILKDILKNN